MELRTNLYSINIIKKNPNDVLMKAPYHVVITICDASKFHYIFCVMPTEKLLKKCVNNALTRYVLGG